MIGIDVLEIDRLERALARTPNLQSRLFTDAEVAYANEHARPAVHLAARFCAKEAVAKALALDTWAWQDVEVLPAGHGAERSQPARAPAPVPRAFAAAPSVRLSGRAAERAAQLGATPRISLTHSRNTAAAVAILA